MHGISTQHDWLRYLWAMISEGDGTTPVPLDDMWEIIDDANPRSWNVDDAGTTSERPHRRMKTAAEEHPNDYTAHHAQQDDHGLDH